MSATSTTVSTWAPLRTGVFRALWVAVLISNVAIWMQTGAMRWGILCWARGDIAPDRGRPSRLRLRRRLLLIASADIEEQDECS
jgi:hypothetical protein